MDPSKPEVSVIVIANLDDTKKFLDKVKLLIENSHMNSIPAWAVGTGTTTVTDKLYSRAQVGTPLQEGHISAPASPVGSAKSSFSP